MLFAHFALEGWRAKMSGKFSEKPDSLMGRTSRSMRVRSLSVICAATFIAAVLIGRLIYLQIVQNDHYKRLVIEQMIYEVSTGSARGNIYDRNHVTLATNYTTERVFISPYDMKSDEQRELVAKELSEILGVDYDSIIEKTKKVNRKDETIKKNVEKEDADKVRQFILDNDLSSCVHLVETSSRIYPYSTLASHVIGFCGVDGGLYGLEYQYDKLLTGISGKIVSAQNGKGGEMPYQYEQYIDAKNGANLVTTIDYKIQSYLEKYLEQAVIESGAKSRACGIVMDPQTGEIYAMATYPYFDLNSPYTPVEYYKSELAAAEQTYGKDSEKYQSAVSNVLLKTWNNKAITETYEPGSTSKVFTTSMALEEGKATLSDKFYCPGYYNVAGWSRPIKCHKTTGHGSLDFAGALQQSCNPAMMMLAERIGADAFINYFCNFGLNEKTGIDLPGEASSIYKESLTGVDLAVYSFGQRYNVTAIQQITAVAAVANGGTLVTPHLVKEITDNDGNVLTSFGTMEKRQVISASTSATISQILADGVSGNGGARNAYVAGYKVAAKTGTSEKGTSGGRIASTVAYAPADDPQVICIIIVDEPTIGSIYGSTVAAPYVSKVLSEVLPYLGIEPEYKDGEMITLENLRGSSLDAAKSRLSTLGLSYEVVGSGTSVVNQVPVSGSTMSKKNGKVILYTESTSEKLTAVVPKVIGLSAQAANELLTDAGFNVKIEGATGSTGATVVSQSLPVGTVTEKGTVITIDMRHMDGTD